MEYRAFRILYPRSVNKVVLFCAAITTFYITWELNDLSRNINSVLGVNKGDIRDFQEQWCRMQRRRVDWGGMARPCEGQVAWDQRQVNSELRTDASRGFIKKWEIQPAGTLTRKTEIVSDYSELRKRTTKKNKRRHS